ncbi:MAG: hypothetical protein QF893_07210 [Alphaproteobacteria bacterium]|jgi:chromosomal replication initiation ATPase DnaA|nr:hypothetical protein [Alphaproteobacteria bacterium]
MMPRQLAFALPVRPALGREDFLVAACNADAVAWLDRWPGWPGSILVVHGPAGSGKSHLAKVWQGASGAREIAPDDLAELSRLGPAPGCSVLLDDADRDLDAAAEHALLHLVNYVREGGGSLLLTGRDAPARWPLRLPDLASRLNAAASAGIGAPDDPLLAAILSKLFHDRQVQVGAEVISYLLSRIERSFAAARTVAERLDAAALGAKRPITVPLARRVLEELQERTKAR